MSTSHHADPEASIDPSEMYDDPEAGSSWFVTIAGIVLTVVLFVALAVMFFRFQRAEFDKKVVDKPAEQLMQLRTSQQILLSENQTYTDPESGETLRRIPIGEAMRQVAAEYGHGGGTP